MKYQLINPITCNNVTEQILLNRNIPKKEMFHYLNTTDNDINQPEKLGESNLRAAASLLAKTIQNNQHAIIIVDSDVDGFTSSAILLNYLYDFFPHWVLHHVQFFLHNGKQHGLNDNIEKIKGLPYIISLVIVPDAGSNDIKQCEELRKRNINTIILDHHLCDEVNTNAIVINNQLSEYPNKMLSGAGVVWQFCRYLDKLFKTNNADNYLDLVALGLCADVMSMTSIETKHLVNKGFQNVHNPFFSYLAEKNEYSMGGKINHTSVAFYIAPFINAICRSGELHEKQIVFESMLKYKAFTKIASTKRGHFLGEQEELVQQAVRVAVNVKARQTKEQNNGMEQLENMIKNNQLLNHKVLLFLLQPGQIDRNIAG